VSRGALWTARVLSALGVLLLLFDATIKVAMMWAVRTTNVSIHTFTGLDSISFTF
jgi:hypothetical protein